MQPTEPHREERPWGSFVEFTRNIPSTVKLIFVKPGEALSLQKHAKRNEFWRIISGTGMLQIGDKRVQAVPGDDHVVPVGVPHRIEGGTEALTLLEIAFGQTDEQDVEESDITRIEDRYGRAEGVS